MSERITQGYLEETGASFRRGALGDPGYLGALGDLKGLVEVSHVTQLHYLAALGSVL